MKTNSVLVALLFGLAAGLTQAAPDAKAARFYEDALGRYERRDIAGAIVQLKNALQIDRNMLPVQVLLGKALLANGEAVAAEVALTEAMRLGVNRAEVVVPLAQALVAQGKQKRVLDDALFRPAGLPGSAQVPLWLLRAAAAADVGDLGEALKAIDEARIVDAKSPEVWLAEVPVRIRARQWTEATAAVERALALAPNSAEAWYQKGAVLHVQGDVKAALAAYDRALTLDAAHVEARIARVGLYIDLGRSAEALADVTDLQRRSPREPRAAYLRALLAERDDPAAARRALAEVTALIDPVPLDFIRFRPQLLMLNGLAHFGLNEPEKAKPYLEVLQRMQNGSPVAKLLAQIYLTENNGNRATEVLEAYLKAQPADSQALTLLASAYMALGKNVKAATLMQEALRGNESADMRAALGMSLIGAGKGGNAIEQLEAAFKADPKQTQAGAALVGLYLRSRQPAKALAIAENLNRQLTSNPATWNLLGMARAQSGNVEGARQAFEQAVKLDRDMTVAKLNLARLDMAAKAYDAANARLAELLKADESNVDAMLEMARLSDLRAQPDVTQRWLEKANDRAGPRELRPGLALVDLQFRLGRPALALDAAKALSAKAPEDLAVLLAYSRAQIANGAQAAVRPALTTATRLAEFNAPLQVEIAQLQQAAGNPTGAAYSLEKALAAAPDYVPAMVMMASLDLRSGDIASAERRARQLIDKNPKRSVGFSVLADVALARSQPAAAIDALRRGHQVEPGPDTLVALFRALSMQDGKAAIQLAEQWLKTRPNDLVVRNALADGYAQLGNNAAARSNYEAVLRSAPDDPTVLNNLANVLLRLKDPRAVQIAEQALAKSPNNPNVIDTLGWALFQRGDIDRALQYLRDARLRDPGNPETRYHLATALAQTGRRHEAREELEAALKGGRSFEQVAEAELLLKTLR